MPSTAQILVKFAADVSELVKATDQIERSVGDAGKATKKVDWKNIAQLAAGATALAAGAVYIKRSADATTELAKATSTLSRATGLDAETASAWVQTLKLRGIEVSTFQTSLVKLSKLMEEYRLRQIEASKATAFYAEAEKNLAPIIAKGGDAGKEAAKNLDAIGRSTDKAVNAAAKAAAPFERLGVKLADVRKGDVGKVLLQIADGFQEIENPATKAATAALLFGRAGQKLVPILSSGSEGIQKQLDLADKYNATIGEEQVRQVKKNAAAQKELELAQQGVQIQLGSALLPAQVLLYEVLVKVTRALAPVTENMYVMVPAMIAATVGFVALKVATIAATIASIGFNASMLISIGIVAAVVIGLILLGTAFVLAYKKIDVFREIVDATWSWIKRNWPLLLAILLGPIAVAAVLIIRNWDRISDAASNAVATIKAVFGTVKAAVLAALSFGQAAWEVINNIGETINRFDDTIRGWGRNVANWIKQAVLNTLLGIGGAAWNVVNNIWEVISGYADTIIGWGRSIGNWIKSGLLAAFAGTGQAIANALKNAINAVLRAFNALEVPGFKFGKGRFKVSIPDIPLPDIPLLARGGIVTAPTLAMVGERGPEAVIPLGRSGAPVEVRVFIGETELTHIVRTEVIGENNRTAQTLLAGAV